MSSHYEQLTEAHYTIGMMKAALDSEKKSAAYWKQVAYEEMRRRIDAEATLQDMRENG